MLQIAWKCQTHHAVRSLDWTVVWRYQTVQSGLFASLHFKLETGPFFPKPDRIFQSRLWSQFSGLCSLDFWNGLKKG